MTGIFLIVIGLLTTITGMMLFIKSSNAQTVAPDQQIESNQAEADKPIQPSLSLIPDPKPDSNQGEADKSIQPSQSLLPKQKTERTNDVDSASGSDAEKTASLEKIKMNVNTGLEFEKYVVLRFNEKTFKLKNWAGDKYVNGRYAETSVQPDLQLELTLKDQVYPLAVECKWRSKPASDFIRFADDDQLKRYKAFEDSTKIPTFIVLGVGGVPSSPPVVYVIPVGRFKKPIQHFDNLEQYKRKSGGSFFFEYEKQILK